MCCKIRTSYLSPTFPVLSRVAPQGSETSKEETMGEKRNKRGGKGERVGARDLQGAISDEWASVRATKKNRNERS